MIPFPSLTKSAATVGFVVLLLAVAAVSSWVTRRVAEPNTVTHADTVRVEAPLTPSEILDATTPTQVTEYDTSETRTQCIEVPTWLATHTTTNASSRPAPASDSVALSGALSSRLRKPLSQMRGGASGPPYAITPMTTGRPSLSVGSSEVTLSGYLPDGRGRQWTYDIPQETWSIAPSVTAVARWVQGTLTADVMRHAEWGPLDVRTRFGLGYGALVTDETAEVSPVARAGFRIGYDW